MQRQRVKGMQFIGNNRESYTLFLLLLLKESVNILD